MRFWIKVARAGVMEGVRLVRVVAPLGLVVGVEEEEACAEVRREVAVSRARPERGGRAIARAPRMLGMGRVRWLDLWRAWAARVVRERRYWWGVLLVVLE